MAEEIIEIEKVNLLEQMTNKLGTEVMADCFVALTLSMLRQFLLSSNHKFFIINDMFNLLKKKGYSVEQVNKVREGMQFIVEKYNLYNDFVG